MIKVGDVYRLHGFGKELDEVVVLQVDNDWFLKKNLVNCTIMNTKIRKAARYKSEYLTNPEYNFVYVKNIGVMGQMSEVLYENG